MTEQVRIVAIVGPTGSGKTEIGIRLAEKLGGEIISVDSMQIYRWMDIGTAKPTPEMRAIIPHHLIDFLDPDQPYNAGKFAADADAIISQLCRQNKPSILVGGTALYLRALINGIIPVPDISPTIRQEVRGLIAQQGIQAAYNRLKELDSKSADKLHPNDISRISRALEVVLETGNSIQDYQKEHGFQQQRYNVLYLGPQWPRDVLYHRINIRVEQMIKDGLVDEVESLLKMGYDTHLAPLNSIGYKQTIQYIQRKIDLGEMIRDIQKKSRHYSKKQLTWYKKDQNIRWLDENKLSQQDIDVVEQFYSG